MGRLQAFRAEESAESTEGYKESPEAAYIASSTRGARGETQRPQSTAGRTAYGTKLIESEQLCSAEVDVSAWPEYQYEGATHPKKRTSLPPQMQSRKRSRRG